MYTAPIPARRLPSYPPAHYTLRAGLLLLLAACLIGSACRRVSTTTTELSSPDGLWLASALTQRFGGSAHPRLQTTVILKRVEPSNPVDSLWRRRPWLPMTVLRLAAQPAADSASGVQMQWLTPRHLEIAYTGEAQVELQVAQCADVQISLRQLPGEPATSTQ